MRNLGLRIWGLAIATLAIAPMVIKLLWEAAVNPSTDGLIMSALVLCGMLGFYALIAYVIFSPSRRLLKSLSLWTAIAIAGTGAVIGGIIHLIRFLPSPQFELPWSMVIAVLYLLAGANAYGMTLWYVWSLWKKKKSQE
jgi:hypothetical protein